MNHTPTLNPHGAARTFGESLQAHGHIEPMEALLDLLKENVRLYAAEEQIVHLADEVVNWVGGLDGAEKRATLLLVLCSLIAVRQGSTRIPVRGPESRDYLGGMMRQLTGSQDESATALKTIDLLVTDPRLQPLIGTPRDFRPLVFDDPYLYHQKMYALEDRFARRLLALAAAPVPRFGERAVDREIARVDGRPLRLSDEQRAAVRTALLSPFTVISGGPGTGKTTVIVSLLRTLCRLGVDPWKIALSAPTGKAAHRMTEIIGHFLTLDDEIDRRVSAIPPPRTLHRLLGYSPSADRFHHHENNRLSAQVVIVDEASMIDLFLMERLVRSLGDDGRLVLIGDAEQLPSVEAGAVLRDIMPQTKETSPSPIAPRTVVLRKNFRMDTGDPGGLEVLTAAEQIREGRPEAFAAAQGDSSVVAGHSVENVRFRGVEVLAGGEGDRGLPSFLDRWFEMRVRALSDLDALIRREYTWSSRGFPERDVESLERLFDHFDSFRVLCITRVHETGSEAVNRFLHMKMLEAGAYDFSPDFVPGEPIVMEHNDYSRNVFNGDQGVVLRVRHQSGQQHFMAVFRLPDGFSAYHLDSLRGSITQAFAMTVHKSQGSEFDHVALVLPRQEIPLLTRELLYTAVTRSRKSVTIFGSTRIIAKAVQRRISRFSGIAEKLRSPKTLDRP
jgi:exodeoxyribonuclease V alpha subunit